MVFENRIYLKRIIIIASTILIVILLALTGLRIYGASLVSDANHEQSTLIKNCPSATWATSVIDSIMRSEMKYNVFIFKDGKMRIVENTAENVAELKKLKIYDENDKCFTTIDSHIGEYVTLKERDNGGDCYLTFNIQEISPEKIIEENSFSGSFYRLTYGYSLPRTILDILEQLTALEKNDKREYLGVSFIEGRGQLFFYNYQMKNIELGLQFEGLDDNVKALDVFSYLLDIELNEYVQEKVDRLNMNGRYEDQRSEMEAEAPTRRAGERKTVGISSESTPLEEAKKMIVTDGSNERTIAGEADEITLTVDVENRTHTGIADEIIPLENVDKITPTVDVEDRIHTGIADEIKTSKKVDEITYTVDVDKGTHTGIADEIIPVEKVDEITASIKEDKKALALEADEKTYAEDADEKTSA